MRTASHWGRIAVRTACLAAVAAVGLVTADRALAQNGYVMYPGMPMPQQGYMMYGGAPMAQNSLVAYSEPAAAGGAPAAAPAESGQPCCACQEQSGRHGCGRDACGQCGGDGDGDGHRRRSLLDGDYWDGRRKCNDCPYGMDKRGRCSDPKWDVTMAGLYMSRNDARKGVIVRDAQGQSLLSTSDLDGDWELGPRLTAVRRFENFDFESVFWAIEDWDLDQTVAGSRLKVPLGGLDALSFDSVNVNYRHRLYNAEGNLKIRWGEAVNILLGSRVMEFHERLYVNGAGLGLGPFGDGAKAEAANYLYGVQIGADTDVPAWFGIKFNAFIKAGVFKNHIREFWGRHIGLDSLTGEFTDERTAFVGETGATVTWQLHKNIGVFGGYEWMFIDGVVQAPDMITQAVVNTNTAIYQGALLGVNVQW